MKLKKLMAIMMVSSLMVAGCGNGASSESITETESVQETETVPETETEAEKIAYTQDELKKVLNLSKDRYVLEKSKNVDVTVFTDGYNTDVVKDLAVDDSQVDWDTPGTYAITYTLTIDTGAMDRFLADQTKAGQESETAAETEEDSSKKNIAPESHSETASSETVEDTVNASDAESDQQSETNADSEDEVTVETDVTIVDEETAAGLIEDKIPVLTDDNEPYVGASEETEDTQETETEEKEAEEQVKETEPVKTSDAGKGNSGNTGTSDKGSTTTKQPETQQSQKPSQPETQKPSQPETQAPQTSKPQPETQPPQTQAPETQHTHTWVAQTTTVHHDAVTEQVWVQDSAAWDEPVYGTKVVCGCGAIFDNDNQWEQHSIDGCPYGYSVQSVQTGTVHHEATGHYETKVVQDAYDETVTTGYVCSGCGATK